MRILITGASGQIGGALRTRLATTATILVPDRQQLDLSAPASLPSLLERLAPDLIINAAAYTAVDRAEDEPELARLINAEAPAVIARWSKGRGVPLVHFSTDYVFDGAGADPWREDSAPGPLSVYGATKLAADEAIRASGAACLIVRTSWIYAARGTNFLTTIARLAQEREQLRIVADQIGAPTPARVVAEVVMQIVSKGSGDLTRRFADCGGILNIAASGETSFHGFATQIVAGLKARRVPLKVEEIVPIRMIEYPMKAKRPANCRLDLTRLMDVFGITAPSWQQGLEVELSELAKRLINGDAAPGL